MMVSEKQNENFYQIITDILECKFSIRIEITKKLFKTKLFETLCILYILYKHD